MSFAPGQIITATRLNRLQTKSYFAQCSGTISTVGSGDVAGTPTSIVVETNGATAAFSWTASVYNVTGAMASAASTKAVWDVNSSPTFAVVQQSAAADKVTAANFWSTSIPTAGTYTFKLGYTVVTNSTFSIYTAMMVQIMEVA